ncbi:hypothetical protein Ancab_017169 [Ancistrocladus abbreviatus]
MQTLVIRFLFFTLLRTPNSLLKSSRILPEFLSFVCFRYYFSSSFFLFFSSCFSLWLVSHSYPFSQVRVKASRQIFRGPLCLALSETEVEGTGDLAKKSAEYASI